jgi:hypothetical protein
MDGLPLDPWIFELAADVHHPGRLYASLDGDGLFRSDDYGRHWAAIDTGLPLHGQEGSRRFVLFTRQGYLWITDTEGTDPGVLTVEHNVQLAALSPDGAAAAYLTENKDGWAVRVLGAGGSAARTAALGHAPMPVGLLWAPSSAMLAVVSRDAVEVAGVGAERGAWRLRSGQRVVGWSADGRGLLVWQSPSGAVTLLSWRDGQLLARIGVYPGPPVFSRDGKDVAVATRGRLWIGRVGAGMRRLRVAGTPALEGWSEDGSTLLVRNGSRVEMLDDEGRLIAQTALAGRVGWLPGSDRRLLTGAGGSLRVWSSQGMHTIVNDARPIESMRGPVSP